MEPVSFKRGTRTETAPARTARRGRLCRNSGWVGWPSGRRPVQPRFLHSDNESGGLFAAISRGLRRALRLGLGGITDGLGQHLTKLGLGLRRFSLEGFLPLGHGQYVGMPEGELKPARTATMGSHRRVAALFSLETFPKRNSGRLQTRPASRGSVMQPPWLTRARQLAPATVAAGCIER